MENTSENREKNMRKIAERAQRLTDHLCLGILAHVDAGKTTLAESMLYLSGSIRKQGRVDHKDAFLDTYELERARGITIFSKQARFLLENREITLLDTPGHEDFGAEMERTLSVLDYAVLIISGADGVRGHDETLWRLLERYRIPTFIFVNKMDQPGCVREELLKELNEKFKSHCVDFSEAVAEKKPAGEAFLGSGQKGEALNAARSELNSDFLEAVAMSGETLLEKYLDTGNIENSEIAREIKARRLFPCFFGAALKNEGVWGLLWGIDTYTVCKEYPAEFGARVYKISRDDKGTRLTHMKITGGVLKVKQPLSTAGGEPEKADQIRVYSGSGYKLENEAAAGDICAVAGPVHTYAGQGLGVQADGTGPVLKPVLTYEIRLPEGSNVHEMLLSLRELGEEIPGLNIVWNEQSREIHAQVMGEVQLEILKSMIASRYGVDVEFGPGSIVYKETIAEAMEGVGHFEPLRHYAEVHLLMEPLPEGSGLIFAADCSEDVLDRNWQRLVLTHLAERRHPGVLTGSEITDMKITLMSGRAHLKHTEGGDFRQATYRAVRQGLKSARCILLEPVYAFSLEIPGENVGRALSDIQKMCGTFEPPEIFGEMSVIRGTAPVALMRGYPSEVSVYTKGRGRLFCEVLGYAPCHNADEIIAAAGYDSESDLENPTGSVFCAHGSGFNVPWNEVPQYMHLPSCLKRQEAQGAVKETAAFPEKVESIGWADEKELEEIFVRTYGPIKRNVGRRKQIGGPEKRGSGQAPENIHTGGSPKKTRGSADRTGGGFADRPAYHNDKIFIKHVPKEYLLVDGYNIIFAWDDLNELSKTNMDSARMKLADILCDYQGYCNNTLILVFDAYRVEGHPGEILRYKNIYIVYTKEAETADQYIEKTVHDIGRRHHVTVATSDGTEQVIIMGQGARRLSARGLLEEIQEARRALSEAYLKRHSKGGQYLMENIPQDMAQLMEDIRLGYREFEDAHIRQEEKRRDNFGPLQKNPK